MRLVLAAVISLLGCAPVQRPPPEEPDPPVGEPKDPRPIDLETPPPPPPAPPAPAAPTRTASAHPRVRIIESVLPE